MGRLNTIDLAIVAVYMVGTTLLGVWFTRRQHDVRGYFVGDKNVQWWLVLASIVATETSAVTFLSVPGLAFKKGGDLTFLQLAFGYVIGRIVIAWLLLPMYFKGEFLTSYQVLRNCFGPSVQKAASALFMITRTLADGLRLFLAGMLMQQFTGWPMEWSITIIGLITLFYTFMGGMHAVVWTDLIQFAVKILGAAFAAMLLIDLLPGGWNAFIDIGNQENKFTLFNFSTDPAAAYTFWAGLFGGAFFTMASHGVDQMMVQRYLCARSLNQARAALVLSGFVVLFQFLLFLLIGVGLFAMHRSGMLTLSEQARPDEVFGAFIVQHLPTGVVGLVIAAVLAAAMSTLASSLNSSANAALTDFYRSIKPGRSESQYLKVARGLTIFFGFAQIGVAIAAWKFLSSERSIVDQVLAIAGFTTGIVLGLFILGKWASHISSRSALVGMAVGFVVVLAIWLPATWGTSLIAWPWFAPIGAFTTAGAALIVHKLSDNGSPPNRSS